MKIKSELPDVEEPPVNLIPTTQRSKRGNQDLTSRSNVNEKNFQPLNENGKKVKVRTDIFFSNCAIPDGYFRGRQEQSVTVNARQLKLEQFKQLQHEREMARITTPQVQDWLKLKITQRYRQEADLDGERLEEELARKKHEAKVKAYYKYIKFYNDHDEQDSDELL